MNKKCLGNYNFIASQIYNETSDTGQVPCVFILYFSYNVKDSKEAAGDTK